MTVTPKVSVSVVSHGQMGLLGPLLRGLSALAGDSVELILTLNVPEPVSPAVADLHLDHRLIRNARPLGFGANHNQAFQQARGEVFCIVNPDISWADNPFSPLVQALSQPAVGLVAPRVLGEAGRLEDSARRFPTLAKIWQKARHRGAVRHLGPDYTFHQDLTPVDWVAGMFMACRREVFAALGGFDERYFLYYEDVDLCARARLAGFEVVVSRQAQVVHDARRHSHANLRYAAWHARSMLRFFSSDVYRGLRRKGWV